jgi:hypothetical protein
MHNLFPIVPSSNILTPFSVVNFNFLPDPARWLGPTFVGVTGIFIWRAYYKKQFAREASAS